MSGSRQVNPTVMEPQRQRIEGNWWFMPVSAGTTGAKGLLNVLQGARLQGTELFVREVTQNAVDAYWPANGGAVKLDFRTEVLTPGRSRRLEDFLLGSSELVQHVNAFRGKDRFPEQDSVFDKLASGKTDIPVLFAEDWGTVGLGGDIGGTSADDHFTRLVYLFGQTHEEGTKGGAFGFGKSVLSVASAVRTVVYYSKPAPRNGVPQPSRLIAVSLFPDHIREGRSYTGYALCGSIAAGDSAFPIHPLEGALADDLARELGFVQRGPLDSGTSMLVLGCAYDIEEIRSAVEKWWWPRIVSGGSGRLEVTFKRGEETLPSPDPKSRTDLLPFITAYERILDRRENEDRARTVQIRSVGKRPVGTLSLVALEDDLDDEDESWFKNRVATFRGPRLVVEYLQAGRDFLTPFVGVFVADPDVDRILRRSEPPAHDHWAPESERLDADERENTIVAAVHKHVWIQAKEFQEALAPQPKESTRRFRALETLLGQIFRKGSGPGPVPPGDQRPVHLSVQQSRIYGERQDQAIIEVWPREGVGQLKVRLEVEAHVLGDADRRQLEKLEVQLRDDRGTWLAGGVKAGHSFDLPEGAKRSFVASVGTDLDSVVRFKVRISGDA